MAWSIGWARALSLSRVFHLHLRVQVFRSTVKWTFLEYFANPTTISSSLKLSVLRNNASYGQQLHNLQYEWHAVAGQPPSRIRKIFHFFTIIILPWAWSRLNEQVSVVWSVAGVKDSSVAQCDQCDARVLHFWCPTANLLWLATYMFV